MKLTIEDMHALATERGGKCLSDIYANNKTHLRWQCDKGHEWNAFPFSIIRGSWCLLCSGKEKLTIKKMHESATQMGGQCLSTEYVNNNTHLHWRCDKGHEWWAAPNHVVRGRWCRKCGHDRSSTGRRFSIENMNDLAAEKRGRCISTEYINDSAKLSWRCDKGHEWKARPGSVKRGGWCPECAKKSPLNIENMNDLAAAKGGRCISSEYVNSQTSLRWQCAEGHEWDAVPNSVQQGTWCRQCAGLNPKTIKDMHRLAEIRGGKCLSLEYINTKTHLIWQCAKLHKWDARPEQINQGRWCPVCASGRGEQLVRSVLRRMYKIYFPKSRPAWLMGNRGKPLELDGYAESLAIAFEYHGKQHYETTWRFDANTVRDQQERDALKLRLCHERGVRLVVVPQFRSFGNLSGCIDQIEAAVLFAGLKVPRWKRPADLSELMVDAPMKPRKRAPETNGLDLFAGAAMP